MKKPDSYDHAIQKLLDKHRETGHIALEMAWNFPLTAPGGCLFGFCSKNRGTESESASNSILECGCLTQVRHGEYSAETQKLTDAIRGDKRIPHNPVACEEDYQGDLKPILEVFAEWQRRLDKELDREPVKPPFKQESLV